MLLCCSWLQSFFGFVMQGLLCPQADFTLTSPVTAVTTGERHHVSSSLDSDRTQVLTGSSLGGTCPST